MDASHSPVHAHTPTPIGCRARNRPARREQPGTLGVLWGHSPGWDRTGNPSDCQTTALASMSPQEKSRLYFIVLSFSCCWKADCTLLHSPSLAVGKPIVLYCTLLLLLLESRLYFIALSFSCCWKADCTLLYSPSLAVGKLIVLYCTLLLLLLES